MRLSPSQFQQTQQALLSAYTSWNDLAMMVRVGLNENLEELVSRSDGLDIVTFNLIRWAERKGRMRALIEVANADVPGNNLVRQLAQASVAWPGLDEPDPDAGLFYRRRTDFYHHIPLPTNYVPRLELLAELKAALLADGQSIAVTSAVKMSALHGMGGIGKTVAVRALCEDEDVHAAYPDGILWATVGQTPDLIARLREWANELHAVVTSNAPSVDELKNAISKELKQRSCLLIADDVWRKEHAEAFADGGPQCRLVITTRDAAMAEDLGATVQPVPLMTQAEAVMLLEEWAGGALATAEPALKVRIVDRLGRLPLAVRLAGDQLRRQDPGKWLAMFDAQKLKTQRVEKTHDSLERTFALSLDALDPETRRLYVALAIFNEDEATPLSGVARLWEGSGKYGS